MNTTSPPTSSQSSIPTHNVFNLQHNYKLTSICQMINQGKKSSTAIQADTVLYWGYVFCMKSAARGKKCYTPNEIVFSQTTSCLYFNNHTAGSMSQQWNVNQGAQTCGLSVHFIQPSHHITAVTDCGPARCLSPRVLLLVLSAAIFMWHRDRRMSSEQWWNGADRGKPNYSEKNLSQCQSVHQNSPSNLLWIKSFSVKRIFKFVSFQCCSTGINDRTDLLLLDSNVQHKSADYNAIKFNLNS